MSKKPLAPPPQRAQRGTSKQRGGPPLNKAAPTSAVITSTPRRETMTGNETGNWDISSIPSTSGIPQASTEVNQNAEEDDYEEFSLTPSVASIITNTLLKRKTNVQLENTGAMNSSMRSSEAMLAKVDNLIVAIKSLKERQKLAEKIRSELNVLKDPKFRECVDSMDKELKKHDSLMKLENVNVDQNDDLEKKLKVVTDSVHELSNTVSGPPLQEMLATVEQFDTKHTKIQDNSEKALIESLRLQRLAVHKASMESSEQALKDHDTTES